MNTKDIFAVPPMLDKRIMIVTTPNGREICGQSPSAFMKMWMDATQPPGWEERVTFPEPPQRDIVLIQTKHAYGKRHVQTGSMRQKKQRRHQALYQVPFKTMKFVNCHPVAMGMDTAAPGVSDQTVIDVSFTYDAVKKA